MQNILDTQQFLAKLQTENIVEKKRHSAIMPICTLLAGAALIAVSVATAMPDIVSFTLLVAGGIMVIVGIAYFLRFFDKKSGYYLYAKTHSRLRTHSVYVAASDKELCRQIVENKDFARLADVHKNNSTLTMLNVTVSDDNRFAVIQLYEYDLSFVPASECAVACDNEVEPIRTFLNKPVD